MMRPKAILLLSVTALIAGVVAGCAKQGYPSGGPVDRTPPRVLSATPPSGTNNFKTNTFTLQVDEYVSIKDADNNILVSPPMKVKPEYTVRGHKIIVRMEDTLLDNTTYLFQFKGAIVDFTEGNALQTFEYVFSTGESIDSMTLRGRVVDALTLKSSKETISVLAYDEKAADSAVVLEQPRYFTRCDTGGYFTFNHIAAGRYRLLALVDGDRNLRLNPGETMAFLDSAVTAVPMPKPQDTTAKDSTLLDSTAHYDYIKPDGIPVHFMRASLLKVEQQRVTGSKALSSGHFQIVTKNPLSPRYSLTLLSDTASSLFVAMSPKADSLDVWTATQKLDSVVLLLTDDTLLRDTLTLQYHRRASAKRAATTEPERLKVQSLVAQNHPYYDTLRLRLGTPVVAADTAPVVTVMDLGDSTVSRCPLQLLYDPRGDSSFAMTAMIDFHGVAGGRYKITIPEAMTDIYGSTNDSLVINTTYTKPENYGGITMSVDTKRIAPGGLLLVQLLNEKGDMVRQVTLAASGTAEFPHLKGGKYTIRLVNDADGDGQWTPGDYWSRRQPEEVVYTGKVLELRENWEMTERFHW
ncbi:MAG: Ig-like domain-containing protein [Bacteroidales bacterium]|nr:Ig-like domain-containing protein [Bacteroidales bacterium]